eukprot:jgi/Chrzof1/6784/Cz19g09100.t1
MHIYPGYPVSARYFTPLVCVKYPFVTWPIYETTKTKQKKNRAKEEQHKDTLDKLRSLQYRVKCKIRDTGFTGTIPNGIRPRGGQGDVLVGALYGWALRVGPPRNSQQY